MSNINLFESAQGNVTRKNIIVGKALILPLAVLVGIFLILGGAKAYLWFLNNQIEKVNLEKASVTTAMVGKNVDRVADLNERELKAFSETTKKENMGSILDELEKTMVSGAKVETFNFSSAGSRISMIADNFKTVARQVMSFKGTKNFNGLVVEKTARDKDGGIVIELKK